MFQLINRCFWVLAVVALVQSFTWCPTVQAKVVVQSRQETILVWGRTLEELTGNTYDHVYVNNGRLAAAMCGRQFKAKYSKVGSSKGPWRVESVVVYLNIVYYYPKWGNLSYAPPQTQRQWRRYKRELVTHEETHGTIAKKWAQRMNSALVELRAFPTEQAAEAAAQKVYYAHLAAEKKEQEAFDARSNPVQFPLPDGWTRFKQ